MTSSSSSTIRPPKNSRSGGDHEDDDDGGDDVSTSRVSPAPAPANVPAFAKSPCLQPVSPPLQQLKETSMVAMLMTIS